MAITLSKQRSTGRTMYAVFRRGQPADSAGGNGKEGNGKVAGLVY